MKYQNKMVKSEDDLDELIRRWRAVLHDSVEEEPKEEDVKEDRYDHGEKEVR